jgi:L-aspartate oxidase
MWQDAGLARTGSGLAQLAGVLEDWTARAWRRRAAAPEDRESRRLASLLTVGLLIARGALRREESRGGHFREDFPQRDDIHWRRRVADALAL